MPEVFLIYQNRLFGDVIRAILATHPEIKLLGATDLAQVSMCNLAALSPSVILCEEESGSSAMAALDQLLAGLGRCRLIALRSDDNGMQVWSRTWQETARTGDLVDAILSTREDCP